VGWKCGGSGFPTHDHEVGRAKNSSQFSLLSNFFFLQALTAQQAKAEADVRVLGERKEALQQEWEMARYTMWRKKT
jgi:hypothetical protein